MVQSPHAISLPSSNRLLRSGNCTWSPPSLGGAISKELDSYVALDWSSRASPRGGGEEGEKKKFNQTTSQSHDNVNISHWYDFPMHCSGFGW